MIGLTRDPRWRVVVSRRRTLTFRTERAAKGFADHMAADARHVRLYHDGQLVEQRRGPEFDVVVPSDRGDQSPAEEAGRAAEGARAEEEGR